MDFGDADGLWTSFPARAVRVAAVKGGGVTYRLTLPADVRVGFGAVRVATAAGVSSLQPFLIDDLPGGAESGTNTTPRDARPLTPPLAIDGTCAEATGSRYYKLAGTKGGRFSAEVVAQRLGSPLDPLLRLLDPAGCEVAWCDDSPGAGSDCRLAYAFPADGQYLLEVRDVNYDGGPDYRFRLRVGDFPLPAAPFPLGGKKGETVRLAFDDPAAGPGRTVGPLDVTLPADVSRAWAGVTYGDGQGSAFVPVLAGDRPEVVEVEPNDQPADATRLTLPATVGGRVDRPGDRDYFQFEAKKGDRLSFAARGRSLGLPCEPTLRLFKADGSKLPEAKPDPKPQTKPADAAEVKIAFPEESSLETTIPDDGVYRLRVEDLSGRGGAGAAYLVDAERVRPGFTLSLDVEKVDAAAGGAFTLKVTCARRDYNGPVALSLGGAGTGFAVENAVIPEGKNETLLKVNVPADAAGRGPANFTLLGRASIAGQEVVRPASTAAALKKLFPRLPYPPAEWDGLIGIRVRPASSPATTRGIQGP